VGVLAFYVYVPMIAFELYEATLTTLSAQLVQFSCKHLVAGDQRRNATMSDVSSGPDAHRT
jgi:hypothetical protein